MNHFTAGTSIKNISNPYKRGKTDKGLLIYSLIILKYK